MKRWMFSSCLLAVVLVAASSKAVAAPTAKLMMTGVVAERGVDDSIVRLLNELILAEITRLSIFETIGDSDVKSMMSAEVEQQLLGCDTSSCIAEIGGALGAEYLLVASLGKLGESFLLNIKVLNVRKAVVLCRFSRSTKGAEDQLIDAVRDAVREVGVAFRASGALPLGTATTSPSRKPSETGVGRFVALGTGVALAGAGAALLFLAPSETSIRKNEYAEYVAADESSSDERYRDVKAAVARHNLMTYCGYGVLGAAVIAGGITAYLFAQPSDAPTGASVTLGPNAAVVTWQGSF